MKKVIKVKLDPQSVADAIKEIQEYKADLERRVRQMLRMFTDNGIRIAKAKVVELGIIHDSKLTNSIYGFVRDNVGFLRVDDENAVFFEFGTGPVGASNPHPLGGNYKSEGWFTQADGAQMHRLYGWRPLVNNDGSYYYFTEGQKAKPFMYETALKLRDEFPRIVREVFG